MSPADLEKIFGVKPVVIDLNSDHPVAVAVRKINKELAAEREKRRHEAMMSNMLARLPRKLR